MLDEKTIESIKKITKKEIRYIDDKDGKYYVWYGDWGNDLYVIDKIRMSIISSNKNTMFKNRHMWHQRSCPWHRIR